MPATPPRLEPIADSRNCGDLTQNSAGFALMPMAQEARKAMFMLKPADGAIGAHQAGVTECYNDFKRLAKRILAACDIPAPDES